jgi:hypothetical protein
MCKLYRDRGARCCLQRTSTLDRNSGKRPVSLGMRGTINFRFSKADRQKIERLVVDDFFRKHMGFEQLFLRAYRICARMALNRSICPYRKSGSIPPIDFYQSRYLPLFQALGLPYTSLLFVDGNLANNMPPSPVRSKLVQGWPRRRVVVRRLTSAGTRRLEIWSLFFPQVRDFLSDFQKILN